MTAKLIMAIDYYITKWQKMGVGTKILHETTFALTEISVAGSLADRQRVRGFCRPFCLELVSNDIGSRLYYFPLIAQTGLKNVERIT